MNRSPISSESGIWSVDAIQNVTIATDPLGDFDVQLVCYHEASDRPVGVRHVRATKTVLDFLGTHPDPKRLHFGRAFHPVWKELRQEHPTEGPMWTVSPRTLRFFERIEKKETELRTAIAPGLAGLAVAQSAPVDGPFKTRPEIFVMNVGQGDTILIALPDGKFWLVDAFSWTQQRFNGVINEMAKLGCTRGKLSRLVVSHFHYDHIRRACELIDLLQPGDVVVPNHVHLTTSARNLLDKIAGMSSLRLDYPTVTTFPSCPFSIYMAPTTACTPDPNEHAIVLYCESNKATALLSGDVPGVLLDSLLGVQGWAFPHPQSSFYKVTHHCSRTGSFPSLLTRMHPTDAATSCSALNRYGHPHQATRTWLERALGNSLRHRLTFQSNPYIRFQM